MSDDRSETPREYHRPVQRPASSFDRRYGSTDPAEVSRAAHATASALLTRVRDEPSDEVVRRLREGEARADRQRALPHDDGPVIPALDPANKTGRFLPQLSEPYCGHI